MSAFDRPSLSLLDPRLRRDEEFRKGLLDMGRVMPGVMAWALVTGVAMAKAGIPMWVAVLMSVSVYAASAQLAAVPLMLAGAPLWVVWLTAMCVNLRFVIFSVQMRRHMMVLPLRWRLVAGYLTADVAYVMSVVRHGAGPDASHEHVKPLAYLLGLALMNWAGWNVASLAGVLFAAWIPQSWGLAFAGTLALLALLVTLAKDLQSMSMAVLAGCVAVLAIELPYRMYIVTAVAAAVASGLLLEQLSRVELRASK